MLTLVNKLQSPKSSIETHLMLSIAYAKVSGNCNDVIYLNQLYYTQPAQEPACLAPFTNFQPQKTEMNTVKIQKLVEASTE